MQNLGDFSIKFEKIKDGYSCYSEEIPGCVSVGGDAINCLENMAEAMRLHFKGTEEDLVFKTFQTMTEILEKHNRQIEELNRKIEEIDCGEVRYKD